VEWCCDWFGNYPAESVIDPVGLSSGAGRVLRGGSWLDDAGCPVCLSLRGGLVSRSSDVSFRLPEVKETGSGGISA